MRLSLSFLLSGAAFVFLSACLSASLTLAGYVLFQAHLRSPWAVILLLIAFLSAGAFVLLNLNALTPAFTLPSAALLQTAPLLAVSAFSNLACLVIVAGRARY